jgi:flagellar protein FlgJ
MPEPKALSDTEKYIGEAVAKIAAAAVICEVQTGCPAELSAAQCILESNWLRVSPENNCFGIKDTDRYPGCHYQITKEYLNGQWQTKNLAFEVYPTLEDCFVDHAVLITGGAEKRNVYAPAWQAYQADHDLDRFILAVARLYATDPNYAVKVLAIAHSGRLTRALTAARVPSPPIAT